MLGGKVIVLTESSKEGSVVLAAMKYAINWVLSDAEPLSQHMAASVGCEV